MRTGSSYDSWRRSFGNSVHVVSGFGTIQIISPRFPLPQIGPDVLRRWGGGGSQLGHKWISWEKCRSYVSLRYPILVSRPGSSRWKQFCFQIGHDTVCAQNT
ncbi:hypothetical protein CDAR_63551 [Caerostris darwini]|uniref:Ycf15 n=1 Tax=Caerostris darwini TaxID=1538125 RepID=A0AAV4QGF7_9ARAC|nr:hypothetical protein CDAR_63551 [Caerostris darwini]